MAVADGLSVYVSDVFNYPYRTTTYDAGWPTNLTIPAGAGFILKNNLAGTNVDLSGLYTTNPISFTSPAGKSHLLSAGNVVSVSVNIDPCNISNVPFLLDKFGDVTYTTSTLSEYNTHKVDVLDFRTQAYRETVYNNYGGSSYWGVYSGGIWTSNVFNLQLYDAPFYSNLTSSNRTWTATRPIWCAFLT